MWRWTLSGDRVLRRDLGRTYTRIRRWFVDLYLSLLCTTIRVSIILITAERTFPRGAWSHSVMRNRSELQPHPYPPSARSSRGYTLFTSPANPLPVRSFLMIATPLSTPLKKTYNSPPRSAATTQPLNKLQDNMDLGVTENFIGPMPVRTFFGTFLPTFLPQ